MTFVGDAAQCIYQFQGSDSALLLNLKASETTELNINYRSTQEILDVGNKIAGCQIKAHDGKRGARPVLIFKPQA